MRGAFRMVAVLRSALSARTDLLLEILALRHQLGVLDRSNRRFRPSDRLLWVCLRRWWPQWKEALALVQPATVARWQHEGFRAWWTSRSRRRRPGRPPIDVQLRGLIKRMAMENGLWGAPRIHGELLKLGSTVSERTVSRYLPDPRTRGSQTWGTFLANHVGNLPFASATSSFATSDDDVDGSVSPGRPVAPSRDDPYASDQSAFADWPPSRLTMSLGWRVAQTQLRCTHTRFSSGRDPPRSSAVESVVVAYD